MATISEWNNGRGEIQIHKPGCKDIKGKHHVDTYDATTVREIVEMIYPPSDFNYDADTEWQNFAGDIRFMPCCPDLDTDVPAQTAVETPVPVVGTRVAHHTHKGCGHELTPDARAICRASHTWDGSAWVPNA
jgi:hypothetical protein